jgi:ribosomal protein S18 acetylase RimI-like enzyme
VSLRAATAGDAPAVTDLMQRAYRVYLPRMAGAVPAPMQEDYGALIAGGLVTLLMCGPALAGVLVLRPAADHLLLDNVAIDPAWQGRGFGRLLVAHAEDEARRRGLREVRLYTHETMVENQALYRRLGFAETGRAEQAGLRRVFMAKAVPPAPEREEPPGQLP